jgi:uncharacterized integral membrane protein
MEQHKNKSILFWIAAGVILTIVVIFSVLNWQLVDINFLFIKIEGRLFLILLIFFLLGFFLGKISHLLRKHKENKEQRRRGRDEYVAYIEEDN